MLLETPKAFCERRFDYVIVGGGTAGLVLAARLSEDPDVLVGVLEAGRSHLNDPKIQCPGRTALFPGVQLLFQLTPSSSCIDMDRSRVRLGSQDHTPGPFVKSVIYGPWPLMSSLQVTLDNRVLGQPRGKGLGGSSAINLMMCTWPSRQDLDDWAALGIQGWSFDNLAPYYRKFEGFDLQQKSAPFYRLANPLSPSLHNANGPIQVSFPREERTGDQAWLDAFNATELKAIDDAKGGHGNGAYSILQSVDSATGFRSYSASAFYQPASRRPNLSVLTEAQVQKVTFEGSPPRATGLLFHHRSTSFETLHPVTAKREVILCAGSFHSPQILELSGVGSGALLRSRGVPVIADNPHVGQNLQDHTLVPLCWEVRDGIDTLDALVQDPKKLEEAMDVFWKSQKGPLSAMCSSGANLSYQQIRQGREMDFNKHALKNVPSSQEMSQKQQDVLLRALKDPHATALQIILLPIAFSEPGSTPAPTPDRQHLTVLVTLSRPLSRGSVHIASADVRDPPLIDPRYLSHPADVQVTADALLWTQQFITTTPPLSNLLKGPDGAKVTKDGFPTLKNAEDAAAWARKMSMTEFHPLGTCAIGPRDRGGVVDERLRVYGVRGLRVVDASVAPMMVRNNVQSMVYAIAERAADLIKEDWPRTRQSHL